MTNKISCKDKNYQQLNGKYQNTVHGGLPPDPMFQQGKAALDEAPQKMIQLPQNLGVTLCPRPLSSPLEGCSRVSSVELKLPVCSWLVSWTQETGAGGGVEGWFPCNERVQKQDRGWHKRNKRLRWDPGKTEWALPDSSFWHPLLGCISHSGFNNMLLSYYEIFSILLYFN